jgi:processive 1,2-diacylglycerol beta-glucosyltransferase
MTATHMGADRLAGSEAPKATSSPTRSGSARGRVTFLSSSWGGGHAMVAKTLRDAVLALRPDWEVRDHDYFEEFVGRRFSQSVARSYLHSVQSAPFLYDLFYRATQRVGEGSRLQAQLNHLGRDRLREYVHLNSPDMVVCTYPTPAGVLSALKLEADIDVLCATVITDYAIHRQWMHPGVDLYVVGGETIRDGLAAHGIDPARVLATGIPIRPGFEAVPDGRPDDGPVLVMVGAVGMLRGAHRLCKGLTKCSPRTVVVCGRDEKLREGLLGLEAARDGRLDVRGYVDEIWELMAEARLLVTKPGGITVSEALAAGLPMVAYGAIPGQEEENVRFLAAAGAAHAPRTVRGVCDEVGRLLGNPDELAAMAARAKALGRPHAARDAAARIVSMVEERNAAPA